MSIFDTIQALTKLDKTGMTIELREKIVELQGQVVELKEENTRLKEENLQLHQTLTIVS